MAIAGSVLDYVVREMKCLCLFITHYQSLAGVARGFEEGGELRNVHMRFTATNPGARGRSEDTEAEEEEKERMVMRRLRSCMKLVKVWRIVRMD